MDASPTSKRACGGASSSVTSPASCCRVMAVLDGGNGPWGSPVGVGSAAGSDGTQALSRTASTKVPTAVAILDGTDIYFLAAS